MAAIGALDKARRPEHQPEDQSLPLPPPRPPPRRQIAAAPGITETGQCSPSISWELGAIARHAHLRRRSKSFSTLQHSRQTSHTSSQSLSPTSTRTSTASIHLETPRLVAGAFEWGVGSCATDAMDNSTAVSTKSGVCTPPTHDSEDHAHVPLCMRSIVTDHSTSFCFIAHTSTATFRRHGQP